MRCVHSQKKKKERKEKKRERKKKEREKKKVEKSVLPEEGRMRRGTLNRPPLRKEAVISLLVCFVLSVKEFQKLQVVDHDFHFFPSVAACQRKGGWWGAGGSK